MRSFDGSPAPEVNDPGPGASASPAFIEFRYVGQERGDIPANATRLVVDPSVIAIPRSAFYGHQSLVEVVLPTGLTEIGEYAFDLCPRLKALRTMRSSASEWVEGTGPGFEIPATLESYQRAFAYCDGLTEVSFAEGCQVVSSRSFIHCHNLKQVSFPSTVETIEEWVFSGCHSLSRIDLPDSIRVLQRGCFGGCSIRNFRVPPLVQTFDTSWLSSNGRIASLELHENVGDVISNGLMQTFTARNIAISTGCRVGKKTLRAICDIEEGELEGDLSEVLSQRFDGLSIHKLCYYQSYLTEDEAVSRLRRAVNPRLWLGGKDKTGNDKDCLGMTPLHILACSTAQRVELHRLIIKCYPDNLITRDRWGDVPLTYAAWVAPPPIIQLMVESYKDLYPGFVFDWGGMIKTLASTKSSMESVQILLGVQSEHFDHQPFDLLKTVREIASSGLKLNERVATDTFRFLVQTSISDRCVALKNSRWQHQIGAMTEDLIPADARASQLGRVLDKLESYENMKEGTTLLELALWKWKLSELKQAGPLKKKARLNSQARNCHRVNCGAGIVVPNVLSFL